MSVPGSCMGSYMHSLCFQFVFPCLLVLYIVFFWHVASCCLRVCVCVCLFLWGEGWGGCLFILSSVFILTLYNILIVCL